MIRVHTCPFAVDLADQRQRLARSIALGSDGIILPQLRSAMVLLWCGVFAGLTASAATLHVWPDSPIPTPPFTDWATAAKAIQDAVDAAQPADTVLVTNGVYATGGRAVAGTMTNRVVVDKAIAVRSVNGPEETLIVGAPAPGGTNGDGAIRCVYLGGGAFLSGFTLTNGHTRARWPNDSGQQNQQEGGGVWCVGGMLTNCTLTGNSATYGGGTYFGTLNNCIVYYNTANIGANYSGSTVQSSCTFPLPSGGAGNITNGPALVDSVGGNLRLQSNSPCINAGLNAHASGDTDLDGLARIVGGTVDIGPYEFQAPASQISYAWLLQYGLPTDGSADTTDPDADRLNNWQKWRCGTDPTNALSVLRLLTPLPTANDVNVSWQSVAGVSYFLERSTNLAASPPFLPLGTNIIGQAGTTTFTDTNVPAAPPAFYRVGVTAP